MNMRVNGEDYQAETGLTIGQLLHRLGLQAERVVLEINTNIINAADSTDTELHDGDNLEIIQFVGGG